MSGLALWERLAAAGLAISGGTLLLNLALFRQPQGTVAGEPPHVSILVPARNEERAIARCVRSLLAQDYPAFELLALDDHSEDRTGEILRALQAENHTLRLLSGQPLPEGWTGKNWACHQLARAASPRSAFLLFTDADTVHAPDALRRAVAETQRDGLALLSLMPAQEVKTWAEAATVSLLPLQILGYLPLPALEWLPVPAFAAANGQYMLFRRAAYEQVGGHAAHAGAQAEDVALARRVKAHGGRLRLGNGAGLVRCRMYHSAGEVIGGFRRTFASGFRMEWRVAAGITLANGLVYLLPFLAAPFRPVSRWLAALILVLRGLLAWRSGTPLSSILLHPLGIALLLGIQLLAAYDAVMGKQATWKGRRYQAQEGQG